MRKEKKEKEKEEREMTLFRGIGNNMEADSEMVCGDWWTTSKIVAGFFAGVDGTILEKEFTPRNPRTIDYEKNVKFGTCDWIESIISDDEILDHDCLIVKDVVEYIGDDSPCAISVLIFD